MRGALILGCWKRGKMNSSEPLVSIIVPVYNTEKYLPRCIHSILEQTYKKIELLLIDDGSTDSSGEICDAFFEKDKRVITIHQKNQGVSAARICGFENSHGQYIMFVDSDDYIAPSMVGYMISEMLKHRADLSICQMDRVSDTEIINNIIRPTPGFYDAKKIHRLLATNALIDPKSGKAGFPFEIGGKIYKREIMIQALNEGIGIWYQEDMIINFSILFQIHSMIVIPEHFYYYFSRPGQATLQYRHDAGKNFLVTFDKLQKLDNLHLLKEQLPVRAMLEAVRILSLCERKGEGKNEFMHLFRYLRESSIFFELINQPANYGNILTYFKRFLILNNLGYVYYWTSKAFHILRWRRM